jgi:hypothetical protein
MVLPSPSARLCARLSLVLPLLAAAPAQAQVRITSLDPGARVAKTAAVTTATARNVTRVQFLADNKIFAVDKAAPFDATWDASATADGRHEVVAVATLPDGSTSRDRVEVVSGQPTAPLWNGDFQTGDLSQWQGKYFSSASLFGDRLQVLPAPGADGYAARFEVRQGDRPVNSGGDRNELIEQDRTINGAMPWAGPRWYAWSVYIPADYNSDRRWQTITQWHQSQLPAPSPLKVMLDDTDTSFVLASRPAPDAPDDVDLARVPLVKGEWHRWVVGVDWSNDPRVGWVEAYVDGRQVLPRTYRATQFSLADGTPVPNHFKQGLYRDRTIPAPQVLYLRDTRVGVTMGSVTGGW